MGGGAAPDGRPQVIQENSAGRAGERGTTWAGGEGEEAMDYVEEGRRVFGITGYWSTPTLDPGARYNTQCVCACALHINRSGLNHTQ